VGRYAEGTSVPMERSRTEIEKTLMRYGASGFGYGWEQRVEVTPPKCRQSRCDPENIVMCLRDHRWEVAPERRDTRDVVLVGFRFKERRIQLEIPMPTEREAGTKAKHEAAVRQRWRALVLVIKAKLEAVASGISTLEHEFLANVVLEDGRTVAQALVPRLHEAGRLLLPPASSEA
jgi:hypothetical protein